MRKKYILDTNILLTAPQSITSFEDNIVIIPAIVFEELDNHKTDDGDRGYCARETIRILEALRKNSTSNENFTNGISTKSGGLIVVSYNYTDDFILDIKKNDNKILASVNYEKEKDKSIETVLVTNDIAMRIKADTIGIKTEEYKHDTVNKDVIKYTGRKVIYVPKSIIETLYKDKVLMFQDIEKYVTKKQKDEDGKEQTVPLIETNEFIEFVDMENNKHTALAFYNGNEINPLATEKVRPYKVSPRNKGQYFLQEALLKSPEELPLVIIRGAAGTAKTFYSLAVGLHAVEKGDYNKILLSRPNVSFDADIGFLPGDELDKITPLLRFAKDNFEMILANGSMTDIEELFESGKVSAEAMNFMRGRSINNTYILIDEAQNMTPAQAMGIITRAGLGTKVILAGDLEQIDNPKLSKYNNGLIYAIEKMRNSKLCAVIGMDDTECTRSKLAIEAADRMKKIKY